MDILSHVLNLVRNHQWSQNQQQPIIDFQRIQPRQFQPMQMVPLKPQASVGGGAPIYPRLPQQTIPPVPQLPYNIQLRLGMIQPHPQLPIYTGQNMPQQPLNVNNFSNNQKITT